MSPKVSTLRIGRLRSRSFLLILLLLLFPLPFDHNAFGVEVVELPRFDGETWVNDKSTDFDNRCSLFCFGSFPSFSLEDAEDCSIHAFRLVGGLTRNGEVLAINAIKIAQIFILCHNINKIQMKYTF